MFTLPLLARTVLRPLALPAQQHVVKRLVLPSTVSLAVVSTFATATAAAGTKAVRKSKAATSGSKVAKAAKTSKTSKRAASTKAEKTKPKQEKPWQVRDFDGRLVPLPSASKPTMRTPFLIYMSERLGDLRSHPEFMRPSPKTGRQIIDITKASKAIGAEWNNFSEADKAKYQSIYEEEKDVYERALAAWKASLSPQDIKRQNAYIAAQKKMGKKGTAYLRDASKPKRPRSAFFEYLGELRSKKSPIPSVTQFTRDAADVWKQMTADEKAPFEQRARANSDRYKHEMEEYNKSLEARF
jgi:hypothetical protein